jgi:gluconokinase
MSTVASRRVSKVRIALVVMGVSGCGKSAVADSVAKRLGLLAVDGDDLHAPASVAKMRAGQPLTDEDRWPWLDRVGATLGDAVASPAGTVVACSALRRAYRDRLRAACPGLRFVFLDGDAAIIASRMAARRDHYMPPSLLASQLQTLERPGSDESDVIRLDLAEPLSTIVDQACAALTKGSGAAAP